MINEICVKLLNIFQQCAIFAPNVSQCTWTVVEFSEMFNLHPRAGSSGLTPFDYTKVGWSSPFSSSGAFLGHVVQIYHKCVGVSL